MKDQKRIALLMLLLILCMVFVACERGGVEKQGAKIHSDRRAQEESEPPKDAGSMKTGQDGKAAEADGMEAGQDGKEEEVSRKKEPEMKGEISVSSFLEDECLNAAAKEFMKQYPNVKVHINEYSEKLAEPSERDYQTMMNTKLMGGEAEDIIMNAFLPVSRYIEMDAFEDLSPYLGQTAEINEKNYFMNIIRAAEQETGEIYLLPYGVSFSVLCLDEALLREQPAVLSSLKGRDAICFSEGMGLAKRLVKNTGKKNAYLFLDSPVRYLDYSFRDNLNHYLDVQKKEVHIDTAEYISLLKTVKELKGDAYFVPDDMNFYNTECCIAGVVDYEAQAAFFAMDKQSEPLYNLPLADKDGNVMLNANYCLMMNHKSKHKALAWEFIKFLLSDRVQSMPSLSGIPVNRQGFGKAAKRQYDFYRENNAGSGSLEQYRQILEHWMGQINACNLLDTSIVSIMEEENGKYLEGKQSAEKTAEILQRKVEQYFKE